MIQSRSYSSSGIPRGDDTCLYAPNSSYQAMLSVLVPLSSSSINYQAWFVVACSESVCTSAGPPVGHLISPKLAEKIYSDSSSASQERRRWPWHHILELMLFTCAQAQQSRGEAVQETAACSRR